MRPGGGESDSRPDISSLDTKSAMMRPGGGESDSRPDIPSSDAKSDVMKRPCKQKSDTRPNNPSVNTLSDLMTGPGVTVWTAPPGATDSHRRVIDILNQHLEDTEGPEYVRRCAEVKVGRINTLFYINMRSFE